MTPGPKPKAAEIAAAQGNPGNRHLATTSTSTLPEIARNAPEWLAGKPEAMAIWVHLVDRLRHVPYVRETDRDALARYCDHFARWLSLRAKVDAAGESYETTSNHGTMQRINPDFRAMLATEERMTQLEDRFGLTPASRQSIMSRFSASPHDPDSAGAPLGGLGSTHTEPPHASAGAPSPLGLFAPRPETRPN